MREPVLVVYIYTLTCQRGSSGVVKLIHPVLFFYSLRGFEGRLIISQTKQLHFISFLVIVVARTVTAN